MVAAASWLWSASVTTNYWKGVIQQEQSAREAAHKAEVERQKRVAEEIARSATARAEDNAKIVSEMQSIIDEYAKVPPHVTAKNLQKPNCDIDNSFLDILRSLDAAGRSPKSSSPSARLRKARKSSRN